MEGNLETRIVKEGGSVVIKRKSGYEKPIKKIEKPKDVISDEFKQMVIGENGTNPYIDENDAEGIEKAKMMLEKLRKEASENKERNN